MIRLFKYIHGYVKIKVWGYSPERFMNLCGNRDILIWGAHNYGDYYIMYISLKGFFGLRPILRKTKTKVAVQQRYGLPFLMPKMRRRIIFILGIVGCLLFLSIMSNNLWAIELVGNTTITNDKFMDFLKENGVSYGMPKKNINVAELEKKVRLEYPIVTWNSIEIQGTKLYVQIKENTMLLEEKKELYQASDLLADKEGTIVSMITRRGVPNVAVGAVIKPGDLLVSGKIPILGEDTLVRDYQYCNSDADIYIQCVYPYSDSLKIAHMEKEYTGSEKQIGFVEIMGKRIQIPQGKIKYEDYDIYTDTKQMKILDNFYLPVFRGTETRKEYHYKQTKYTKEQAKKILKDKLDKFLSDLEEKGVQIIAKDVKIGIVNETYKAMGHITAVELTGTPVETQKEIMQTTEPKTETE